MDIWNIILGAFMIIFAVVLAVKVVDKWKEEDKDEQI